MSANLTTLANTKMIAGISATSTKYDGTLLLLISRCSGVIRRYLSRELTRATYDELIAPTSRQLLLLKEWPIVSVTSVTDRGNAAVLNTDYRCDLQDMARGVVYKEDGWGPINLVSGLTQDIQAAARTVQVVYVAGYYLPDDASHYVEGGADSLPIELSMVCEELVAIRFQKTKAGAHGLSSYKEGGISFAWKDASTGNEFGISDEQASVLNAYKRFVCA